MSISSNKATAMTIVHSIVADQSFARKAIPHIRPEYFESPSARAVFEHTREHHTKYSQHPSKSALMLAIDRDRSLLPSDATEAKAIINDAAKSSDSESYLIDITESWCQDRALYLAMMASIEIMDGRGKQPKTAIPEILRQALSVSMESRIGHDYGEDWERQYDFYHRVEDRLKFDIDMFNQVTDGGLTKKTLTVISAGINTGKSAFMCHCAASFMAAGKSVLYITLEMSEERIRERIDANLMDMSIRDVYSMDKGSYASEVGRIKQGPGRLFIREYPTATASVHHFRSLLDELKIKKNFNPDVVLIDYINLCCSARFSGGDAGNSYGYVKSIIEEVRGLMVERNIIGITATQFNRGGMRSSDPEMTDTAESMGVPQTADYQFAFSTDETLQAANLIMVKQLKNRYGSKVQNRRFMLGFDPAKMKFFDVEQDSSDQTGGQPVAPPPPTVMPGAKPKINPSKFADWGLDD